MDRRKRKTSGAIFDAFSQLLGQKAYGNITVQEIIEKADVGRSTFYSHFETKDDLLNAFCEDIFRHTFHDGTEKEESHAFSGEEGFTQHITHILYHLQEKKEYLNGLLSSESENIFMHCLMEQLSKVFQEHLDPADGVPEAYKLHHVVSCFAETVHWWLGNPDYTPEQICSFYMAGAAFFLEE